MTKIIQPTHRTTTANQVYLLPTMIVSNLIECPCAVRTFSGCWWWVVRGEKDDTFSERAWLFGNS